MRYYPIMPHNATDLTHLLRDEPVIAVSHTCTAIEGRTLLTAVTLHFRDGRQLLIGSDEHDASEPVSLFWITPAEEKVIG